MDRDSMLQAICELFGSLTDEHQQEFIRYLELSHAADSPCTGVSR